LISYARRLLLQSRHLWSVRQLTVLLCRYQVKKFLNSGCKSSAKLRFHNIPAKICYAETDQLIVCLWKLWLKMPWSNARILCWPHHRMGPWQVTIMTTRTDCIIVYLCQRQVKDMPWSNCLLGTSRRPGLQIQPICRLGVSLSTAPSPT